MPPPLRTYTQPYHGGGRHPGTQTGQGLIAVQAANREWEDARRKLIEHQARTTGTTVQEAEADFTQKEQLRNIQSVLDQNKQDVLTRRRLENPTAGISAQEILDFNTTGNLPDRFNQGNLTSNPGGVSGGTTSPVAPPPGTQDPVSPFPSASEVVGGLRQFFNDNPAQANPTAQTTGGSPFTGLKQFSGGFEHVDPLDSFVDGFPSIGSIQQGTRNIDDVFGDRDPARAYIDGGGYNFFNYGESGLPSNPGGGDQDTGPGLEDTIRDILGQSLSDEDTLRRIGEQAQQFSPGGPGGVGGAAAGIAGTGANPNTTNSGTTSNSIFGNTIQGLAQGLLGVALPTGLFSGLKGLEAAAAADQLNKSFFSDIDVAQTGLEGVANSITMGLLGLDSNNINELGIVNNINAFSPEIFGQPTDVSRTSGLSRAAADMMANDSSRTAATPTAPGAQTGLGMGLGAELSPNFAIAPQFSDIMNTFSNTIARSNLDRTGVGAKPGGPRGFGGASVSGQVSQPSAVAGEAGLGQGGVGGGGANIG